jgi:hypothetical protein
MPAVHLAAQVAGGFEQANRVLRRMGRRILATDGEHAELRAYFGSLQLAKKVVVDVGPLEESAPPLAACVLPFRLRAAEGESVYPVFEGHLELLSLSPDVLEVALEGRYRPPAGFLGEIADAVAFHSFAQRSLSGLLEQIADQLRKGLADSEDLIGHPFS